MKITVKAEYAMILIEELAIKFAGEELVSVRDITQDRKLSYDFMRKIANDLRKAHLIKGYEGTEGGYRLSESPEKLTIGQVMKAIGEPIAEKPCCQAKIAGCSKKRICPHESVMFKLQWALEATYGSTTIDKIAKGDLSCATLWRTN